jgi:hypothetical protein
MRDAPAQPVRAEDARDLIAHALPPGNEAYAFPAACGGGEGIKPGDADVADSKIH